MYAQTEQEYSHTELQAMMNSAESHTALGCIAQSSRAKVPERLNTDLLSHAQSLLFCFSFSPSNTVMINWSFIQWKMATK